MNDGRNSYIVCRLSLQKKLVLKEKMNVAMLGSFPPLRGISSYCYELATSIAGKACHVDFISFKEIYPAFLYPGRDLEDDDTFPLANNDYLHVQRHITWYNPAGWFIEGLRNRAPLLHAQWWSLPLAPIYLCLCMLFKIKRKTIVFTVHNVLPHERSRLFFHLSRLLFCLGDHFIVHTELNRQQLVGSYGIPVDDISLIPHGSLDFQVDPQADTSKIRAQMGFLPEHRVVLIFGAIRPYKGIDTAIAAFAQVKRHIPTARLLIAGKLWQSWESYSALIKHHGLEKHVIARLGYIPSADVHRYFCASDLVILPYRQFDSQSGVGGAAVSFRKPLIVTQVGGLPDLVRDQGAVIPPVDPTALAEAIESCLGDPVRLKKMAQDADHVAQTLSWNVIARQTIAVYESLINKNRAASVQTGNTP